MSAQQIYVILGTSGEYSDRSEWCVRATRTEEAAKAMVLDYERIGRELRVEVKEYDESHPLPKWDVGDTDFDYTAYQDARCAILKKHPDPMHDDEDTRYWYAEIELEG